ncbi:conjugal transfer protein [Tessaracoccus rhinocerotis]|uniref:Conjugal transfer protein n=1 Tax=Tessaracoccus rhinocerotis TaxID=1689449 RepID=A0A553K3X1_9ACTN|nr:Mov34/MPN/PAD-1 family protein [Tessaracoccus rhinocerotis]TRY19403.1 conjugal transfer protein [Tessaracoccus rhinocerotis]
MTEHRNVPSISITDSALATIAAESTRSSDGLETGGILLGSETAHAIWIRHAGDPGPDACRAPQNFLRDLQHAQQVAHEAWTCDGSQWIGEWHTHPFGDLTPSELDLDSYLRHLHDPDLQLDYFVAIIVSGNANTTPLAVAWLIERHRAQEVPLRREHA